MLYQVAVCDISSDDLPETVLYGPNSRYGMDLATLVFVLSAIHPDDMQAVLQRVYKSLGLYFRQNSRTHM